MVRCVITGEDAAGRARVADDQILAPALLGGGFKFAPLWGSDSTPEFPQDGSKPAYSSSMPGPGGYRYSLMRIEPRAGIDDVPPGEPPGMHRTDSVDLGVVLTGAVAMEMDDGQVVELRAGDVFVQNGTNHKWFNPGEVACDVAVVVIGGRPRAT